MDFDNSAQVDALASAPPGPPPAPATRAKDSVWAQPIRGLAAGLGDLAASASELAVGQFRTMQAMDEQTQDRLRRQRAGETVAPSQGVSASGETELSRDLRTVARGYRPDPATTGTAENVVFELSRVLPKAIGYTLAAGPLGGAAALGTDEAMTSYSEMIHKGVDPETAKRVAGVTGVAAGAGILLPMSGSTVARTAGLYALGGPGAFVAQQALTREILGQANYTDLAKSFDPLDTTGLALSLLIPAPFAAWGLRSNLKAKKVSRETTPPAGETVTPAAPKPEAAPTVLPEHIDAAMVHNLTLRRDMRAAVEEDTTTHLAAQGERITPLAEFAAAREITEPAGPKDGPDTFLAWLRDQGGVSSAEKLDITGERSGLSRGAIFKRGGLRLDELARRAEAEGFLPPGSVESALDNGGTRAMADLVQRAAGGERVLTAAQEIEKLARDRMDADVRTRVEMLEERLKLLGEDPAPAKGDLATLESYLAANEDRLVAVAMNDIAEQRRAQLEVPARAPKPPPAQVERARLAMQDAADSGRPLEDVAATLPPDVQNLLVGLREAGADAARAERMLSDFARTAEAQPGRSTVDIAADVVEAGRRGETVTPEPQPKAPATPETAAADSIKARIASLEAEAPDMVVRIDADGNPVTLADELARIRREAASGTDDVLGSNDAPLLRVAADCALSTGVPG